MPPEDSAKLSTPLLTMRDAMAPIGGHHPLAMQVVHQHDIVRGRPMAPATEYFARAIETLRANKERYAAAEAQARMKPVARPSFFDTGGAFAFGGWRPWGDST